jgi:DNA-directed RNA polymerase specialized sigma24 family protein
MQHHRDQDLLAAYDEGDQEAFAALMARHQELVRAACRRQAAAGDWDDCAQAVFLVLSRRADSARRAPALEAWLLRTASYVCRASWRARIANANITAASTITLGDTPSANAFGLIKGAS